MIISSNIVKYSSTYSGSTIVTFELVYPRMILAELNTHRVFSRNSSSSRAIPIRKMIEMVQNTPAMPIHWGMNQSGMQAQQQVPNIEAAKQLWLEGASKAVEVAEKMIEQQLHKQVVNRILEPYQWMKTVLTTTELENFFELRVHKDAQPEIHELARQMQLSIKKTIPVLIDDNEWHLPYVSEDEADELGINDAIKVSASCCAQVSYRNNNKDLDKAKEIYHRLVDTKPVHASPFEHQATPMPYVEGKKSFEELFTEGVTHVNKNGERFSGNFKNWIQLRQLMNF